MVLETWKIYNIGLKNNKIITITFDWLHIPTVFCDNLSVHKKYLLDKK